MSQKGHTQGKMEIQSVDGFKRSYPEVLKLEQLFLAAKVFFDFPSGKIQLRHPNHILFGVNGQIGCQHHGVLGDSIDQNQMDVLVIWTLTWESQAVWGSPR